MSKDREIGEKNQKEEDEKEKEEEECNKIIFKSSFIYILR